uniref:Uncharacterized protein n=1 Tax=Amphimedon queenslandica TaxID=400682 RepID=A0A1X7VPA5_AMPQE
MTPHATTTTEAPAMLLTKTIPRKNLVLVRPDLDKNVKEQQAKQKCILMECAYGIIEDLPSGYQESFVVKQGQSLMNLKLKGISGRDMQNSCVQQYLNRLQRR